ncbi:MAG: hypothetical protein JXA21_05790 [Anaerolineae bacterium]|nr:hypothetical protein [Anaerolineae bacterium]
MTIKDAITLVETFKGDRLGATIVEMEKRLAQAGPETVAEHNRRSEVTPALLSAALEVKRASAQIDVVLHAVGILYALPHILNPDEVVESLSLGANNAGSNFDLVTNQRIAEFKFIHWQPKGNAVRNKTLFGDFFKLARVDTFKTKYLYLLDTYRPLRFLRGQHALQKALDRNQSLANDFAARYGDTYRTVGEFYTAHKDSIRLVSLLDIAPAFAGFIE